MSNNLIEEQELSEPKIRSRRNSFQPIDRHINDIDSDGSICINAGIDSTCGIKRTKNTELSNISHSTSTETNKSN